MTHYPIREHPEIIDYLLYGDIPRRLRRSAARLSSRMVNYIQSILSKGASLAVECPMCGWRGTKFLDYDAGYGIIFPDLECPRCHSHDRHRLVWFFLRSLGINALRAARIAHFAPEKPLQRILSSINTSRYITADSARGRAMMHEDIQHLSFSDRSFDIILCLCVLEHVADDTRALREMYRVLDTHGACLVFVPIDPYLPKTLESDKKMSARERARTLWQDDHVRLYAADFPKKLKGAGFTVIPYLAKSFMGKKRIRRYGLPDHALYLCTKHRISPYLPNGGAS